MPVHPVTIAIALRPGQIDGHMQSTGNRIALADLLIGSTALELGLLSGDREPTIFCDDSATADRTVLKTRNAALAFRRLRRLPSLRKSTKLRLHVSRTGESRRFVVRSVPRGGYCDRHRLHGGSCWMPIGTGLRDMGLIINPNVFFMTVDWARWPTGIPQ